MNLYVHVPFCRARCDYCDFFTRSGASESRQNAVVRRIAEQIRDLAPRSVGGGWEPRTVYVGGGTPSALAPPDRDILLDAIREFRSMSIQPDGEWTVEVNPEDVSHELIQTYRAAGVTRLSLGVQSLQDRFLTAIGRHTDRTTTLRGLRTVAELWPGTWSADLITAIPGQSPSEARRDADALMEYAPPHVSLYELGIEPGTSLARSVRRGRIAPLTEEAQMAALRSAGDALQTAGLEQYETSSFAFPGAVSHHNLGYWEMRPWDAAGPAAVALISEEAGPTHITGPRDFQVYLGQHDFGVHREVLSSRELLEEYLMGGFRMQRGLRINAIRKVFGTSLDEVIPRTLERWADHIGHTHHVVGGPRVHLDASAGMLLNRFLVEAFSELDTTENRLYRSPRWPEKPANTDSDTT